ncbi:MAG TPA: hypothetical protein VG389_28285 [Myxococcota bacterium]|jgi:hypothetical protein|nr:hypothetical protein [Myxococcota bacterium]
MNCNEAQTTPTHSQTTCNEAHATPTDSQTTGNEAQATSTDSQTTGNEAQATPSDSQTIGNEARTTPTDSQTTGNEAQATPSDSQMTCNQGLNDAERFTDDLERGARDGCLVTPMRTRGGFCETGLAAERLAPALAGGAGRGDAVLRDLVDERAARDAEALGGVALVVVAQ